MDFLLTLSRLQFAMTAFFHFIFVPLTLGLSTLIAIMLTIYYKTGNETYKEMAKFWTKLFAINFAIGVATGIVHEFEFGMNWSVYSRFVGDIFGAPLAFEGLMAFFLESTFVGILIFGWDRVPKKVHLMAAWLTAIGSNISAFWILVANGWMQHPVGSKLVEGLAGKKAVLTSFASIVFNPVADTKFMHTITAGFILSAIFVLSISAYHLLKGNNIDLFKKSAFIAIVFGLMASVAEMGIGHAHTIEVARVQPTKIAAAEALWETKKGPAIAIAAWADQKGQRNVFEIPSIPGTLSMMLYNSPSAEVKGLRDLQKEFEKVWGPGNYIPPVNITFWSFHLMIYLGMFFVLLFAVGLLKFKNLENSKTYLKVALFSLPLPYIANWLGWAMAEVGRQPWIVYPLNWKDNTSVALKTAEAVSKITNFEILASYVIFLIIFTGLAIADFYLLAKYASKAPENH
ncbi:cytochrome ubiquinol oxidase subunit I [Desulfurobacterium sp.]